MSNANVRPLVTVRIGPLRVSKSSRHRNRGGLTKEHSSLKTVGKTNRRLAVSARLILIQLTPNCSFRSRCGQDVLQCGTSSISTGRFCNRHAHDQVGLGHYVIHVFHIVNILFSNFTQCPCEYGHEDTTIVNHQNVTENK